MNIQANMSGQVSEQVSNQAGNQLAGELQHNGNPSHTQVQNIGDQGNPIMSDRELGRLRWFMLDRIFEILLVKQSQYSPESQLDESVLRKLKYLTRPLEEGLLNSATTQEEYMNMDTLESRLEQFVKQHVSDASQHSQIANRSNSSIRGGSFNVGEGSSSNGYQQSPSSFSVNSVGNNMMAGQIPMMIPTPAFMRNNNYTLIDPNTARMRKFLRDTIYQKLFMRVSQPTELVSRKLLDFAGRLEERLFESAMTKEEYMNLDTLESRLRALIIRPGETNNTPQHSQYLMIPTPGMQHTRNSRVIVPSAVDPSVITAATGDSMPFSAPDTGILVQSAGESFSRMHGVSSLLVSQQTHVQSEGGPGELLVPDYQAMNVLFSPLPSGLSRLHL